MNYLFFVLLTFSIVLHSLCEQCPAIYLRYSKQHSFCKPKNSTCAMFHTGLSNAEREEIIDVHNKYRSIIATGKEKRAGGMPAAADMLQMVWDKELAAISQKRAEQCIYAHDCGDCRKVENFDVGQNIAFREKQCVGSGNCNVISNSIPEWADVIKIFYDEVADFDQKYTNAVVFIPGKVYGHFTQMVWSKTWRIGCGFVSFKKGTGYRQIYVCNYGPSGNIAKAAMYKAGDPCTSCPINSCCGSSCTRSTYEGLCKMNRNNEPPRYQPKGNYMLYCEFISTTGDCSSSVSGQKKWRLVKALGGPFAEVVLSGGETSTLTLKKTIIPRQHFCVVVIYRTGPTVEGEKTSNTIVANFEYRKARFTSMDLPLVTNKQFFKYSMDLSGIPETKISLKFSVPNGAPKQFLNIRMITVKGTICS